VAQLVVIVEVFIAQRQGVDALCDELADGVLDARRIAPIVEAGCQPRGQPQPPIGFAQQDRAAVGADRAAIEARADPPPEMLAELEASLFTLCIDGLVALRGHNALW